MPLLKATYINHKGKRFEAGKAEGLFLNQHDLFNVNWNVQTRGNRIISVDRRGVKEHSMPFVIIAPTREQACKLANDLFSICEEDLQANKKGRLVVNGYNLNCFIRGQDYSDWADPQKCIKISAKIIRDSVWYKYLDKITFNGDGIPVGIIEEDEPIEATPAPANDAKQWTSGEKGYYYGYPYDYPSTQDEFFFNNQEDVPLSWMAVIYGAASVIRFTIGENVYTVPGVSLTNGERLEITAKEALDEKTVIKVQADGTRVNCFANRGEGLFEPIKSGNQAIKFQSGLSWQLIPIIERSAPKWH